ncbi:P-loop containing nucleoside triphosphate hydrolase protein [Boletus reticuloceps]|uniref:P-loop containing nucleoside triphosphate hydrolase protein n=1 Tax=Boletus reticuloceps TaxID=495285 RepID=A0A8I2YG03_9AGAM|nr:P-loop containing nucleoside triphosphate hydrolase protein [Boletus reticuloceps]
MDPALPPHSSRISRLKKRFLDVLSGAVKLDARGATLFLEGLCVQDDPVVCLDAVSESAHGLSSVRSAMQFDLSIQFMNGLGTTVLQYLLRASDVGGDALDNILLHVVEPPIFWGVFVCTFQQGALNEDAQLVFARLLTRFLILQDHDTTPYRDVAARPSIQASLITSPKHEIREMGHLVKHLLSSISPLTLYDVLNGPGGRHDNDFPDFHDIAILPTADEILCRKPPFLRAAYDDELNPLETPVKVYLDNTFRMLREDMLFDIRQGVHAALQNKRHSSLRVHGVSMVGIYTGMDNRKARWAIKLRCDNDFWEFRGMKDEDGRLHFLKRDSRGSKILRHQSLVCLASGQDIISFGTVNRVEELLARNPPLIVLQLDGDVNIRKTLTSLRTARDVQLIQIDTATFAFEPVLSALKKRTVPLAKEILFWSPDSRLESCRSSITLSHITNTLSSTPSIELDRLFDLPKCVRLDESQAKSLAAGLQQRVSLIQGPPGTGKSFIGALLAKAIHDETTQTILVVCYTNHALDQFLGDLLEYDIPSESIVRLGGRSNNSMEHLSLHNQPRGRVRYDWDEIDELKCVASCYEDKLETHFRTLLDIDDWNLITYLELKHPEFSEAFHVPWETQDGMMRVGRNGQVIDKGYLFSRWIRGLDAGVLSGEPHVQASARIWGMARSARQQLLSAWRQEFITKDLESICRFGRSYNMLQEAIKQKFTRSTMAILRQKRIIACTTTGAAIYADALERVGPEVLLVEEAGEILESHILTALSREVDQMILIGDHKQLRPKVNNYQLTVEKGDGFDLNRSLFERLVLKGYPHETLSTQYRMRPEISAFVRELTYPELIDAPSTRQRPDIRGVQSNVVFVDHTHPEDDDSLIGDRADHGAKSSKQNSYEVQMVLKIVRYLAQQGYKSENIVVLTPYLGQLHQFRDALKHDNDPILNEMDSSDLAHFGLSLLLQSASKAKKGRIHLATIDNYQGEESDIVIASLTRSNKSNAIGFMDSPERLNVLLSRARDGLILIGNSQTFLHSRKGGALWRKFITLLEKGQYIYQGFPVKCERHPEHVVLLKRASDFDDHCPDGGCTEPCGFTLACGHVLDEVPF